MTSRWQAGFQLAEPGTPITAACSGSAPGTGAADSASSSPAEACSAESARSTSRCPARARIVVALAPERLQRPRFGEESKALQPAEMPDLVRAAQAGREHLLHELVPEAGAAPYRLAQPLGELVPAGLCYPMHAAVRPHPGLRLHLRGNR